MVEDEALARQMQANEYRNVVQGQAVHVGAPVVSGTVMQGTATQGVVTQGYVVGGIPAPGAEHGQVGSTVYGTPVINDSMMGVNGHGELPYRVVVLPDIPAEEVVLLNYRTSMKCFTVIDGVSTSLNIVASIRSLIDGSADAPKVFGHEGVSQSSTVEYVLGFVGLLFIIGPICGYIGASRFKRGLVTVYLGFCVLKMSFEVLLAFVTPYLWYILVAIVQIWVTKLVYTFWKILGQLPAERLEALRDPNLLQNAPARLVYW